MDEQKVIEYASEQSSVPIEKTRQVVSLVDEARRSAALQLALKAVADLPAAQQHGFFSFPSVHRLLGHE